MSWYYVQGDQKVGPITKADLKSLVATKKITAKTRVWRPGMQGWQELGQVARRQPPAPAPTANDEASSRQAVCSECGQSHAEENMIGFENAWVCAACKPYFVQKIKEGLSVAGHMDYAAFWPRFGAIFLDGIILSMLNFFLQLPVAFLASPTGPRAGAFIVVQLVLFLLQIVMPAAYTSWFLGKYAATPGKMAFKLKVVSSDGSRISYLRGLGRHFAKWISWMILGIGFLMAAFDDEKRTLHDRICDTRVIKAS